MTSPVPLAWNCGTVTAPLNWDTDPNPHLNEWALQVQKAVGASKCIGKIMCQHVSSTVEYIQEGSGRNQWSLTRCRLGHALSKPSCCDCRLHFVGQWLPGYEYRIQKFRNIFQSKGLGLGKGLAFLWAKQSSRFLLGIFQLWGLWHSPSFQGILIFGSWPGCSLSMSTVRTERRLNIMRV